MRDLGPESFPHNASPPFIDRQGGWVSQVGHQTPVSRKGWGGEGPDLRECRGAWHPNLALFYGCLLLPLMMQSRNICLKGGQASQQSAGVPTTHS